MILDADADLERQGSGKRAARVAPTARRGYWPAGAVGGGAAVGITSGLGCEVVTAYEVREDASDSTTPAKRNDGHDTAPPRGVCCA
jgi:hypothetical protein